MNNCLVTKFKGIVNNDNLDKYGELKFKVNNTTDSWQQAWLSGSPRVTVKTDGMNMSLSSDGSNPVNTVTVSSTTPVYFTPGNYPVYISSKYDLSVLSTSMVIEGLDKFSSLYKLEDVTILSEDSGIVNLNKLIPGDVEFKTIKIITTNVSFVGDINRFANVALKEINIPNGNQEGITGNLVNFAICKSITNINLRGQNIVPCSIEDFATAQLAGENPRVSGTVSFVVPNMNMTYGGNVINGCRVTFANGNYTVSDVS